MLICNTSELKRRAKKREKETEMAKKLEKIQISDSSNKPVGSLLPDDEESLDPNQYYEMRSKAVAHWKESPETHPFPHHFPVTMTIPEYISRYEGLEAGSHLPEVVNISGRVLSKRASGAKLIFYDLMGDAAKVQVMAQLQ